MMMRAVFIVIMFAISVRRVDIVVMVDNITPVKHSPL